MANKPTKEEQLVFAKAINNFVLRTNFNHIDAIVQYCEDIGLDIDLAAKLINSNLKAKIESDAITINLVKGRKSRLKL